LLVLGPAIVTDDFISTLVTTGLGGGAIGVALIGLLGGYALSEFGPQWLRWVSGLLTLFLTIAAVYAFFFADGAAAVPPSVGEVFGALLFVLLMALLVAGVSAPSRYWSGQHASR
jgi:peptidoglycan/LPS O-acetylase OafA/YrhL